MKQAYFIVFLIVLLVCSFRSIQAQLADTPWPMFKHDPQHTGRSPYNGPNNPKLKWKFNIADDVYSSPAISADGTIYLGSGAFGSEYPYVWAINSNGSFKWKYEAGYDVDSSPAVSFDGTIYVGSQDGYLYAFNPNGVLKWEFETWDSISSSPVIDFDGTIYVGSADTNLYAINSNGTLKWKFKTNGYIHSSPSISLDGSVSLGSSDNYIYSITRNGSLKWKYKTGASVDSSPAIGDDGTVYVASYDSFLYAINSNGTLRWNLKISLNSNFPYGRISSPSINNDGIVYFGGVGLYAINPDGSLKWIFETGVDIDSSPAIGADGIIYVGSYNNGSSYNSFIYAINPDGTLNWKFETDWAVVSSPAIGADGTLYFGSCGQYFYAIENKLPPMKTPTLTPTPAITPTPSPTPSIQFNLSLEPEKSSYQNGDNFKLLLDVQTPSTPITGDLYFVMLNTSNKLFFAFDWTTIPQVVLKNFELPANISMTKAPLFDIIIPNEKPPISESGAYTFAIAATKPDTLEFVSNIESVSFEVNIFKE